MQASQSLRLLIVEDSEDDARLILHTLRRGGFTVSSSRVETAEALKAALAEREWDLVISDHNLPQFSAPEALRLVQQHTCHIPFIIVSGSIGEDQAVAAMKAGASDYLVKGHLNRLVPAVRRELADAEQRRRRSEAEETLRQTETLFRHAQKMEAVGRLAGGIAHDFNNILTAILGYAELALQQAVDGRLRGDLEEIRKAGDRAAALTRQLLAFSRQQMLEPRVADFNEIIANVEKMLRRLIGADVEFVTALDPAIGRVTVDPGQMEQVLMNLAVNARDAMPRGGRLTIGTGTRVIGDAHESPGVAPGRHVVITVSDTGVGMTQEVLKQAFEPFFTTKEAGHGTGLGLSTVYGIVKQSGGHITVDSRPGGGTTFDLYLPCVDDEPLESSKSSAPVAGRVNGCETILLVDDDDGARELMSRALKSAGYMVLTAQDGREAVIVAESHSNPIHLLITDLVMPHLGGADLAAELTRGRGDLAVLYMSGYADRNHSLGDIARADRAYLQKPFTPSVLTHKVRELLDRALTA